MMETKVTILCDNSISRSGFVGEHGFSCLIEKGGEKYLFDTGPGMSLPINMRALGQELSGLAYVFISHGHYDHTGGLLWVTSLMDRIEVIAHPGLFSQHMRIDPDDSDKPPKYIGCPFTREDLERSGTDFRFSDHPVEASPGVWFITGIESNPALTPNDPRLVLPRGDGLGLDTIEDDASLLVETDGPPILILGCAHAGVLNILNHLRSKMGITRLRAILGGTHLMFYAPEDLPLVMDEFARFSIDLIAVSHCTGFRASVALSNRFGDRFTAASAGKKITFSANSSI